MDRMTKREVFRRLRKAAMTYDLQNNLNPELKHIKAGD